ncbi:hypothetical protein COS78_01415 [Candidatus Shapirobacteria bacterium CG06_land_8_20_14_3_00_40_12]|uniref:Type II toxin-antitoxin system antitoxin, RelB/DinJ family n=2 Tax=Candidatus Shapironibacteriota TaxID=1752721 RepID=A0A2M7TS27_9BACT|nr:MAG: hypothetical protein COS78_01415 [Candidatus Shapirobacteria bacterium CG06_land_8_20_14_3_00_40_12]PIZ58362.1 MAG: hypothetical protein COY20_03685 [Candidatus Shapirobacteria bacterium CG_4_10_14_0_2_um_filter_40_12]
MNQIINLQIPIEVNLRNQALTTAKSLGFSNLQDTIRLFINQLAKNTFDVSFQPKPVVLSERNDRRYTKIINDIKSGKEKTLKFKSTRDMFKYLNDQG